jgi:hypothetical protein
MALQAAGTAIHYQQAARLTRAGIGATQAGYYGGKLISPVLFARNSDEGDGWKVGDPVDQPNTQGSYPTWETVRERYWMNRAQSATHGEFSRQNIGRMKKGYAPQARIVARIRGTGEETELLVSKELHHLAGRSGNTPHNLSNLIELWPWEHESIDPYRHLDYNFLRFR